MGKKGENKTASSLRLSLLLVLMQLLLVLLVLPSAGFAASVILDWDPSTDADLVGYKVYYQANSSSLPFVGTGAAEGVAPIDGGNVTTATVNGLDPNNSYFFAVTAYNSAGLESVYSNIIEITESVAPAITVTSPSNNSLVSGIVSINANASDNVGVTKVQFFVNGQRVVETSGSSTFAWDTSSLSPGDYVISAKAFDAAGNEGDSNNVTVTVAGDTIPPIVSFAAPTSNATVAGSVVISASANDNINVTKVEIYVDDLMVLASNQRSVSYNWNTEAESNTSHVLRAQAYDAAGNVGKSSSSVTVNNQFTDAVPPTLDVFSLPATATALSVPISGLTATDNAAVTGYLVSESATAPAAAGAAGWTATAPTSFSFAGTGSRTAYAWAKDAAGNVSAAKSANVTITLPDVTAPVTSVNSPATPARLTLLDAQLALQIASGRSTLSSTQLERLDVAPYINGRSHPNGKVDTGDVVVILSKIVGKLL